jgi:hypothetical protein
VPRVVSGKLGCQDRNGPDAEHCAARQPALGAKEGIVHAYIIDMTPCLAGTWFQDHIAPRLAGPETAVSGRVVVNMTPPPAAAT